MTGAGVRGCWCCAALLPRRDGRAGLHHPVDRHHPGGVCCVRRVHVPAAQMPYPANKLTDYLMDLRSYRPKDHRAYLEWLAAATDTYQVSCTCHHTDNVNGRCDHADEATITSGSILAGADPSQVKALAMSHGASAVALLRNLEQVRIMRAAHWVMTQQYIIRNTKVAPPTTSSHTHPAPSIPRPPAARPSPRGCPTSSAPRSSTCAPPATPLPTSRFCMHFPPPV